MFEIWNGFGPNCSDDQPDYKEKNNFCNHVYTRKWAFQLAEKIKIDDTNRLETFTLLDEERQLLAYAQEKGAEYVRIYCNALSKAGIAHQERTRVEKQAVELFNALPPEIRDYALMLENHDWFFAFSDAPDISERGLKKENELKQMAAEKGGLYDTLWSLYADKRVFAIRGGR